jgi:outer membrane receptor for ferrienterochelin and colicin
MRNPKAYLLTLLLLCAGIAIGYGQVTTSSITGTVKTTTGEVLSGATIKAVHQPTGTTYTTLASNNGRFTILNMRVGGPYLITISYAGLQNAEEKEVYLKLGEPYVLDQRLGDKAQLSEVVITASTKNSLLNANRNGATTNISTRQLQTLPTITRSLNDFIRLTPQASSTSTGSIGGGNYRQNYITVDGSDFNNTFGIGTNLPANGSPISLDAISEISVNVSPFDVKQSGFIGSAVNAVTRSGTNDFSGSVYTLWRSEQQQGNKVGYNTFPRQNLDDKTIGFRLGGPIIKNKLFFFVNAEKGETTRPGQTQKAATSTVAGQPGSFGYTSDISRPTASFMDSVSDYLRNKSATKDWTYDPGAYQGYDNKSENTRFVARLDWNINSKHKFNIRYNQVKSKSPSFVSTSRSPLSSYSSTNGRTSNTALWFKNSNYFQENNFYSLAAELNSQFGQYSNTLRVSWTHQDEPRSSESAPFPLVDILDGTGGSVGTPLTTFGYEPFTYGNLRDVRSTSIVDYVTRTIGQHTITGGLQFDMQDTKNGFQRFGTSYYTFRNWNDFITGQKPVDFAVTYPLNDTYSQAFPRFKFAQYSVYGQDEYAVTNRFRLTAGLRLDIPTYLDVSEIQTHPLVAGLDFANGSKVNTGILPKNRVMFSPRLGFNWDVKGDRSVQVRGGTGIFTGRVPTVWIVAQSGDAGLLQFTQTYTSTDRNNPANFITPGPFNPDPKAYYPAPGTYKPGSSIPSTISATDPNFKFPQTWKSSLAVDVKLPWGMVGTLEGVYNKDLNIAIGKNPNLVDAEALNVKNAQGDLIYPDTRPVYPVATSARYINPITTAGQPVASGAAGGGAFNPVLLSNAKKGYYWSITAKLEKQFSKGFSGFIAYTHNQAKVLFDGGGDQLLNTWSNTQIVNNSNDPELSYANYVVPNRVIASFSYRKEYIKHLATSVSLFLEGSIGGRFSYTYSSDFNRDGQTNDLIYVPKDPSEITFVDQTYGSGTSAVTYTGKQQSDLFFRYIEQDKYLSSRKGKYAERNGAQLPWRNQVDVKFTQELFHSIGGKRNTLSFTLDIFNFGNLINKNWGLVKTINAASILVPRNATTAVTSGGVTYAAYTAGGTNKPVFSLASDRNQPVTSTFTNTNSLSSTYYMQFGLRYTFN